MARCAYDPMPSEAIAASTAAAGPSWLTMSSGASAFSPPLPIKQRGVVSALASCSRLGGGLGCSWVRCWVCRSLRLVGDAGAIGVACRVPEAYGSADWSKTSQAAESNWVRQELEARRWPDSGTDSGSAT
jgi:hypothetical protein